KSWDVFGESAWKKSGGIWIIPNVKSNHVEKTDHPCQFPVELIERLVLSLTNEGDWVLDPFMGVGTSIVAATRHNRRCAGAEVVPKYIKLAQNRINEEINGTLKTRPMNKPIYNPIQAGNSMTISPWSIEQKKEQLVLLEKPTKGQEYGEK
ncbi:MAG: site-specific DNA-methyltransferase, partial [Leptolinea sp.]